MARNTKMLDVPCQNVFLTQYPTDFIKSRKCSKLVMSDLFAQQGRVVLRSSKLYQKSKQLRLVDCELSKRRKHFDLRMKQLKERSDNLKRKREELNERMKKFAEFVHKNDLKRNRAIAKRALVQEEAEKAEEEAIRIEQEVQNHIVMLEQLKKTIKKTSKYKNFLRLFVANLPADLFEPGPDDKIHLLIQRYQGLFLTKQKLEERNNHAQEDLHIKMKELEDMKQSFNTDHVSYNQQLSKLQNISEDLKEKIQTLEYAVIEGSLNYRVFESDIRAMLMSIDNMKQQCDKRSRKISSSSSYYLKLDAIETFISNWKIYLKDSSKKSSIHVSNIIKLPAIKQQRKTVVFND